MSAQAEPRAWALKRFCVILMKTLEMSPMLIMGWFFICTVIQGAPLVIQQHEKAVSSTISMVGGLFSRKTPDSLSVPDRMTRIASDLGKLPDDECDAFLELMMRERGLK